MAGIATLVICIAGLAGIPRAATAPYKAYSLFFEQFARIEALPLLLCAAFACLVIVFLRRSAANVEDTSEPTANDVLARWGGQRLLPFIVAIVVAVVVYAGIKLVFHDYLLADDEYSAWFQAIIFSHGMRSAVVDRAWCPYIAALAPTSIAVGPHCTWTLSFLPLHSLLTAAFIALGNGRLVGPFDAALSVLLVWAIARKVWPERRDLAVIAMAVFVTSTQMLYMSMTMFSMPTHLLAALVWMWLYLDDRRWSLALLPWVGVIAMGVHSPIPHLLFIPPFLFRYLRQKRFGLLAYLAVVYAAGVAFWYSYLSHIGAASSTVIASAASSATVTGVAAVGRGFAHLPRVVDAFTTSLHVALIVSWSAPVTVVLVLAAILAWPRLDPFLRDAAVSLGLIVVVRALMPTSQGEGWGYRFIYDALGSMALLAAAGCDVLRDAIGRRQSVQLLAASSIVALLVQVPMRAKHVSEIITPYRVGYDWMASLPYDAVLFPADLVNWGRQLVRNDPFLRNRPKILSRTEIPKDSAAAIYSGRRSGIKELSSREVFGAGLPPASLQIGGFAIER